MSVAVARSKHYCSLLTSNAFRAAQRSLSAKGVGVKIVLPSVTNEVITLVKDTSLVYSVSYIEMFALAKQIAAEQTTVLPFVIAGVFYYVFNFVVAWVMEWLEKKMNYYR